MIRLPRLALAIPTTMPDPSPAGLALLAGLTGRGWRVQHFRSRACLTGTGAVGQITGLPGRHLDAWLMPPETCRWVFARGACRTDLAVVEGSLTWLNRHLPHREPHDRHDRPGDLGPLAEALDLPCVAVIDCLEAHRDGFHWPARPEGIQAVVLDGLEDPSRFDTLRRMVRVLWDLPVLGAVEALPKVRAALTRAPRDLPLPAELCEQLGASFLKFADLKAIRELAASRPFAAPCPEPAAANRRRFRVAFAQDEAFGGYFPDTLETLETLGAELVEFSPLSDETLPEAVDLVMIGCGRPDRFAEPLAANLSLIASLRAHVCAGRRIYSEGGGTAYLSRAMVLPRRRVPGAGILPFEAVLRVDRQPPQPVERVLIRDSWLGPQGTLVRGYRSGRWHLRPTAEPDDCQSARSGALTPQSDLVFRHHALGSLIHLHLAALPHVVHAFAGPHRPSLTLSLPQRHR